MGPLVRAAESVITGHLEYDRDDTSRDGWMRAKDSITWLARYTWHPG